MPKRKRVLESDNEKEETETNRGLTIHNLDHVKL
jgi:hypothetical protein